jgi:hypothetical protein
MVKGCGLWKFEEIVIFTLNLRGNDQHDPKNNSLVIHKLITVGKAVGNRVNGSTAKLLKGD